jgi:hypothetical protein
MFLSRRAHEKPSGFLTTLLKNVLPEYFGFERGEEEVTTPRQQDFRRQSSA